MPAAPSASSKGADWALVRNRTAISRSGTPDEASDRTSSTTPAASAATSSNTETLTSGPGGRCASSSRWMRAARGAAAIIRFARSTTCGVER